MPTRPDEVEDKEDADEEARDDEWEPNPRQGSVRLTREKEEPDSDPVVDGGSRISTTSCSSTPRRLNHDPLILSVSCDFVSGVEYLIDATLTFHVEKSNERKGVRFANFAVNLCPIQGERCR